MAYTVEFPNNPTHNELFLQDNVEFTYKDASDISWDYESMWIRTENLPTSELTHYICTTTPPNATPSENTLWLNPLSGEIRVYKSDAWNRVGIYADAVVISRIKRPISANADYVIWELEGDRVSQYDGSVWITYKASTIWEQQNAYKWLGDEFAYLENQGGIGNVLLARENVASNKALLSKDGFRFWNKTNPNESGYVTEAGYIKDNYADSGGIIIGKDGFRIGSSDYETHFSLESAKTHIGEAVYVGANGLLTFVKPDGSPYPIQGSSTAETELTITTQWYQISSLSVSIDNLTAPILSWDIKFYNGGDAGALPQVGYTIDSTSTGDVVLMDSYSVKKLESGRLKGQYKILSDVNISSTVRIWVKALGSWCKVQGYDSAMYSEPSSSSGGGSATWGSILGLITDQTDLVDTFTRNTSGETISGQWFFTSGIFAENVYSPTIANKIRQFTTYNSVRYDAQFYSENGNAYFNLFNNSSPNYIGRLRISNSGVLGYSDDGGTVYNTIYHTGNLILGDYIQRGEDEYISGAWTFANTIQFMSNPQIGTYANIHVGNAQSLLDYAPSIHTHTAYPVKASADIIYGAWTFSSTINGNVSFARDYTGYESLSIALKGYTTTAYIGKGSDNTLRFGTDPESDNNPQVLTLGQDITLENNTYIRSKDNVGAVHNLIGVGTTDAVFVGSTGFGGSVALISGVHTATFNTSGNFNAHTISTSGGNDSQWNTAYSWGNHADAYYVSLTSYNIFTNTNRFDNYVIFGSTAIISGTNVLQMQNAGTSRNVLSTANGSTITFGSTYFTEVSIPIPLNVTGGITASGYLEVNDTGGSWGSTELVARFHNTTIGNHTGIMIDALTGQDAWLGLYQNGVAQWDIRADAGTGNLEFREQTENIVRGYFKAGSKGFYVHGVGDNVEPPADHVKIDGYGMIANRGYMYVTNAQVGSVVRTCIGGAHSANTILEVNSSGIVVSGSITGGNSSNWNTAYSWGNHATAGYASVNDANTWSQSQTFSSYAIHNNTVIITGSNVLQMQISGTSRTLLSTANSSTITFGSSYYSGGVKTVVPSVISYTSSVAHWAWYVKTSTSNTSGFYVSNTSQDFDFYIRNGAGTVRHLLRSSSNSYVCNGTGNFGINTTTMSYKLHVNGTAYATTMYSTDFVLTSDRKKKNVLGEYIPTNIADLKAQIFTFKDDYAQRRRIGYYSDEAKRFLPSSVTKNGEGFETVSYIDVHTAKIASLENEVAELKAKLEIILKKL